MSTIENYAGRYVDLTAYQNAKESGKTLLSQEIFDNDGQGTICTGVQKVAQRFLIEFLTQKGSVTYFPDRGTTFIQQLRFGYLRTDQEIQTAFAEAASDIYKTLKDVESVNDPSDEKYRSAKLLSVATTSDSIQLTISISTEAGTSRQVILPIATTLGI